MKRSSIPPKETCQLKWKWAISHISPLFCARSTDLIIHSFGKGVEKPIHCCTDSLEALASIKIKNVHAPWYIIFISNNYFYGYICTWGQWNMYKDSHCSIVFTSKSLETAKMSNTGGLFNKLWYQSSMNILTEWGNSMFVMKWSTKHIVTICVEKSLIHICK